MKILAANASRGRGELAPATADFDEDGRETATSGLQPCLQLRSHTMLELGPPLTDIQTLVFQLVWFCFSLANNDHKAPI
jgi:hypothetical protein